MPTTNLVDVLKEGRVAAGVLTGLALWLSYPPSSFPWIGMFALVPLMVVVMSASGDDEPRRRTRHRWLHATPGLAGGFIWGIGVFHNLLAAPDGTWIERVGGLFILAAALAVFLALWEALVRFAWVRAGSKDVSLLWMAPAFWMVLEFALRSIALGFAPYIGLIGWRWPFMLQMASVVGIHGVGAFVVAVNALGALVLVRGALAPGWLFSPVARARISGPSPNFPSVAALALVVTAMVFFQHTVLLPVSKTPTQYISPSSESVPTEYTFLLVQPHFTPDRYEVARQDNGHFAPMLDELLALTVDGLNRRDLSPTGESSHNVTTVVVWPETVLHVDGWRDGNMRRELVQLAADNGVNFIFGLPRWAGHGDDIHQYNSMYAVDATGGLQAVYDKINVIPVAEKQFRSGRDAVVVPVPGGTLGLGICSDIVVPHHARRTVMAGATSLHYIASLGQIPFIAPLTVALAAFRAAEHHVFVTQTATTGPSVVVHPSGRLQVLSDVDEPTVVHGTWSVAESRAPTLYTRFGDWIVAVGGGVVAGWAITPWVRERRRRRLRE